MKRNPQMCLKIRLKFVNFHVIFIQQFAYYTYALFLSYHVSFLKGIMTMDNRCTIILDNCCMIILCKAWQSCSFGCKMHMYIGAYGRNHLCIDKWFLQRNKAFIELGL